MQGLSESQKGVLFCIIAHLFWGGMAPYFGFMRHIPVMEIAVNRGVWSLPIAALIVWWFGQSADVWRVFRTPRHLAILALTSGIIVFNWGFYVWSIEVGRALESSLGYFINPLLNVVAGYFFLHERFNKAQVVAIALAAAGVIIQTVATGVFPWLGLMLGGSFCLYGLLRKMIPVGATQGFLVEVMLIAPPLLVVEYLLMQKGIAKFGGTSFDTLMLLGCGVLTSGALLFFAESLKRIRYSTAGILQYISPSLVFLTAIFMFGEPMDRWKLLSFVFIWVALAIYSWSAFRSDGGKTA
ncbi:MAG: EamA family transporter RarD [Phyllobacteriaceae bacterium]|jgi:chloramphenicol-sensitive protein RarD|nr:EamA family transporter RarD [Phyllobacteriaceae bacterium]